MYILNHTTRILVVRIRVVHLKLYNLDFCSRNLSCTFRNHTSVSFEKISEMHILNHTTKIFVRKNPSCAFKNNKLEILK